MKNEGDTES